MSLTRPPGEFADLVARAREFISSHVIPREDLRMAHDVQAVDQVCTELRTQAESLGLGLGKVAPAVRVAVTGTQVSPSIDHTVFLCGQPLALARIDAAIGMC